VTRKLATGAAGQSENAERVQSPKWALALSGLDDAAGRALRSRMRKTTVAARAVIFRQGEPSDKLVVIDDGRIRLLQTQENGEEFTFGVFVGGTILGLAAVVLGRPHILTAEAVDRSVISTMSRADFMAATRTIPGFLENIARLLAVLSVESIERSGPLVLDDARIRLAAILISLARQTRDSEGRGRSAINGITHEELAKMIGVSRNWVGTALADLERLGLVSKCRGRITVESIERLNGFIVSERHRRSAAGQKQHLGECK
jgi:CRP/FNR family cyclic AMP-dependent transcriptional regulator